MPDHQSRQTCSELQKLHNSLRKMLNNVIMMFKAIQGHRYWYQSKAGMWLPISK